MKFLSKNANPEFLVKLQILVFVIRRLYTAQKMRKEGTGNFVSPIFEQVEAILSDSKLGRF